MVESGLYGAIFLPQQTEENTALPVIELRSQRPHETVGGEWIEIDAW
jgi:hypothetical protein